MLIILKPFQAFYLPCAARENLKVLTSASVNRLLTKVTQEGLLAATGVEFVYAEQTYVVNVTMEVVLCAGYVASIPSIVGNTQLIYMQSFEVSSDP